MTINLDRTHLTLQTDAEFERFVELERERRARGNDRPLGARLSTDCPVRMVQQVYDEAARFSIDQGDAERGHEMESRVRATILLNEPHAYQPIVSWTQGVSAFDFTPESDPVPWDVKSTTRGLRLHSEYVSVTQRRMVAAGMPVGSEARILVVSPANYRFAGPFTVRVTTEAHATYIEQLAGIDSAFSGLSLIDAPEGHPSWRSARWWRETFGLACSCGGCVDHTRMDANASIESMLFTYETAIDTAASAGDLIGGAVSWKWHSEGLRARLIAALDRAVERYKDAARENGTRIDVETESWRCSWSPKADRWTLKRRERLPDDPIPDALKNDAELAASSRAVTR